MNRLTDLSRAYCPSVDLLTGSGARNTLHALDSLSSSLLPSNPLASSISTSHLPYRINGMETAAVSSGLILPTNNPHLFTLNDNTSSHGSTSLAVSSQTSMNTVSSSTANKIGQ